MSRNLVVLAVPRGNVIDSSFVDRHKISTNALVNEDTELNSTKEKIIIII